VSRNPGRQRSSSKAEETRARILEASLELFNERGFDDATMREIAARAGVATGAAYYYFASKEDLVMAFYRASQTEMQTMAAARLATGTDLRARLDTIISGKFEQFAANRLLLRALFRTAIDPDSPISPFGDATADIRDAAIALFADALDGSDVRVPKDLAPHMPRLLWLYQMGLILFWIYDRSENQQKTHLLTAKSLDMVVRLIKLAKFPPMRPLRKAAVELLAAFA